MRRSTAPGWRSRACGRSPTFEYEFQQALINKKLYPEFETVFMTCNSHYMYLSSTMVKQIAAEGRDVREFIPAAIYEDVMHRVYRPQLP